MSTTSFIGLESDNGSINGIYCHWDGYPTSVGYTLLNHYSSKEKISLLLSLGDISSLGKEIGEKHNHTDPVKGWTIAYGRDMGEPINIGESYGSFQTLDNRIFLGGYDYAYIFSKNEWIFRSAKVDSWKKLAESF